MLTTKVAGRGELPPRESAPHGPSAPVATPQAGLSVPGLRAAGNRDGGVQKRGAEPANFAKPNIQVLAGQKSSASLAPPPTAPTATSVRAASQSTELHTVRATPAVQSGVVTPWATRLPSTTMVLNHPILVNATSPSKLYPTVPLATPISGHVDLDPIVDTALLIGGTRPTQGVAVINAPQSYPTRVEDWVLLPRRQWSDEFSPLYKNAIGTLCEGVPTDIQDDDPVVIQYSTVNPESGACVVHDAVANEALVRFSPTVTAAEIRNLFRTLHLEIYFAWYTPRPADRARSMSWFHVGVAPASPYYNDVAGLVRHLSARRDVENVSHNDVARVCSATDPQDFLYGPDKEPQDALYVGEANREPIYLHAVLASADKGRLGADGAWYDRAAGMGPETGEGAARLPTCVVIMDTGIDIDHPDFGLTKQTDDVATGQIYSISDHETTRPPPEPPRSGVRRQGICAAKKNCYCGPTDIWRRAVAQPVPDCTTIFSAGTGTATSTVWTAAGNCPDKKFTNLNRAPSSPRLKFRNGASKLPWNPDLDPDPCDLDQVIDLTKAKRVGRKYCKEDGRDRVAPDALKYINLRFKGHGHGTAMASLVAAQHNTQGAVSFGTSYVKAMSATMRMVADFQVDVASAIKCVKMLQDNYGALNAVTNVRTVLMAFAEDAAKRRRIKRHGETGDSGAMDDLLAAIRLDAAENDRIWIAPASNKGGVDVLSYPAALLRADAKVWTARATGDPAILGVTGVKWGDPLEPTASSNYATVAQQFETGDPNNPVVTHQLPDLDVYGISAWVESVYVMDVRERWYGGRWAYDVRQDSAEFRKKYGPMRLYGYANAPDPKSGVGSAFPFAGYEARTDDAVMVHSGDYWSVGVGISGASGEEIRPANSVAAAQIAALAGIMFGKQPDRTQLNAATVRQRIMASFRTRLNGIKGVTSAGAIYDTGDSSVTEATRDATVAYFVQSTEDSARRVPPPIDFLAALQRL